MKEEMEDSLFVREMRIFWQNSDVEVRDRFRDMVEEYFDEGDRAYRIISHLQEKI